MHEPPFSRMLSPQTSPAAGSAYSSERWARIRGSGASPNDTPKAVAGARSERESRFGNRCFFAAARARVKELFSTSFFPPLSVVVLFRSLGR